MSEITHTEDQPSHEELRDAVKKRVFDYAESILEGKIDSNKWIYAAIKRFYNDLEREDVYFDWEELYKLNCHFERLSLTGEYSNELFKLHDWQLFTYGNIWCWKWTDSKLRRFKIAVVQVARGAGKSTTAAGLCLFDLMEGVGKRIHVLANNQNQAEIILDTAKTMVERLPQDAHDLKLHYGQILSKDRDSFMDALPAVEKSLDGKLPSLAIADEAAEFRSRTLTKLITALGKRKESTLLVTTTPGSNAELQYYELVRSAEAVLLEEHKDDTVFAMLYGLDKGDALEDEQKWIRANPGLPYGQPDIVSIRRAWNTMKNTPIGISDFSRYHCARLDEHNGGWLTVSPYFEDMIDTNITDDMLLGRPCYGGLDLSKTMDCTSLTLAFPLEDGRIFLKGFYWFPSDQIISRENMYRIPVRAYAAQQILELCPGREINYEMIRIKIKEVCEKYDVKKIGYDRWGSTFLAQQLVAEGVPLETYSMSVSTFGPGCQAFQNFWVGKKLAFGNDPMLRRACAEAVAKADLRGNITITKGREHAIIDPLVSSIIAVHCMGSLTKSVYEMEAQEFNGNN